MFNKITYLLLIAALLGCSTVPQSGSRKIAADGVKTEIEDIVQIAKENGLYVGDEKSYMVISLWNHPKAFSAHLAALPEMKSAIIQQGTLDGSPVAKVSWNKLVDSFLGQIETQEQADAFKAVMKSLKPRYILPEKVDYPGQGYNGGWYYGDFRQNSTEVMSQAVMLFESASAVQNKEELDSFLKINQLMKKVESPTNLANYISLLNDLKKNPESHKNAVMILEYIANGDNKVLGPMQFNKVDLKVNKYDSPYANLAYNAAKLKMSQIDPDSYEAEIEKIDFSIIKDEADFKSFNDLKNGKRSTYALSALMTSELNEKAVQQLSFSERALLMAKAEGFYLNDKNAWAYILWYKNSSLDYFNSIDGVKDSLIDVVVTYRDEKVARFSWDKLIQNIIDKIETPEQFEAFKLIMNTTNPVHYVHKKVNPQGHAFDYMEHSTVDIINIYNRFNTAVSIQNKEQLESFKIINTAMLQSFKEYPVYTGTIMSRYENIMQLLNAHPERYADIAVIVKQLKEDAFKSFVSARNMIIELKYTNVYSDLAYNFVRHKLYIESKDSVNLDHLSSIDFSVVKTMEDFKYVTKLPLEKKTVFAALSTVEGGLKELKATEGVRQKAAAAVALEAAQKLEQEKTATAALEAAKKASPANESCATLVKKIMGFFGK